MKKIILFITAMFLLAIGYTFIQSQERFPHGKDFNMACEECHTTDNWKVSPGKMRFDHSSTGFPLAGGHSRVECRSCHTDLVFSHISTACVDCHTDIHRGKLGDRCSNCHTPGDWQDHQDILQKHSQTQFPLLGVHATLDCDACHIRQQGNEFANTPIACSGCHMDDFRNTTDPNHLKAGFSSQCETCHQLPGVTWTNAVYQHPSGFVLQGAHVRVDCIGCHSQTYAGTPTQCNGCHLQDYNQTTEPDHKVFGFPTDCAACHDTQNWQSAQFDHLQRSGFELTGAHRQILCNACHVNNQVSGLPRDCYGCHQSDFTGTTDPNHVQNNFDHNCTTCHSTNAWSPSSFDHSQTQFPLTGAHMSVNCISCHSTGYNGTPTDCFSCHQADFNGTTDPNHVQNNFDHDCTTCHNTNAWSPSSFDHSQTQFPLTGAHVTVNCISCHSTGYTGTPTDCYSCHQADFNGTTDPNHVQNNFDHDCTTCHNTTAWDQTTFDHSQTQFPLTGAHMAVGCISCHGNGYTNTPTDCYACHQADFNGTTDPNHVQNNFDHDCTTCHNTTAWDQTTFDHSQTQFPLTGAHMAVGCISCHGNGYTNTPTDCYACHKSDYDQTNDPNHAAANFPTQCQNCHNTSRWGDANWDHDNQYFPIYSGTHRGTWNTCGECHINPANYATFECILCHEHSNQTDLANKHSDVNGYEFSSAACYNCHPRGSAEGGD